MPRSASVASGTTIASGASSARSAVSAASGAEPAPVALSQTRPALVGADSTVDQTRT